MRHVSAIPAYGRDYKSKKALLADWNAGKDFNLQDMFCGGYVNIAESSELIKQGIGSINIRYKKSRCVAVIELTGKLEASK